MAPFCEWHGCVANPSFGAGAPILVSGDPVAFLLGSGYHPGLGGFGGRNGGRSFEQQSGLIDNARNIAAAWADFYGIDIALLVFHFPEFSGSRSGPAPSRCLL